MGSGVLRLKIVESEAATIETSLATPALGFGKHSQTQNSLKVLTNAPINNACLEKSLDLTTTEVDDRTAYRRDIDFAETVPHSP